MKRNDIQTIYCDLDGVVFDTIAAIVDLYNEDYCYYKDYKLVHWYDIETWNFEECTCATYTDINNYFNQPRFFDTLEYMPFADIVIPKLANHYKIVFVSSGHQPNLAQKKELIRDIFPFAKFIGVNWDVNKDKSHIDMSDGIFIDDSATNLITSNAEECICFGDEYEWNKKWNGKRISNWCDLEKYLL